jgi:hypothetical protein
LRVFSSIEGRRKERRIRRETGENDWFELGGGGDPLVAFRYDQDVEFIARRHPTCRRRFDPRGWRAADKSMRFFSFIERSISA